MKISLFKEINREIVDGIDHTKCMLIFVTENYARKVNGGNDQDYCKREFGYGFEVFGRKKIIAAAVDESMLDSRSWKGIMRFNLGSVVPFDLSNIFKASSCELKEGVDEVFDRLYDGIVSTISNQERVNEVNTVPVPSALPLSDGKTTHVFLSHDWG